MSRRVWTAVWSFCAASVAACGSTTAGDARGTTATSTPTASTPTSSVAPSPTASVAPVDVDPCTLLTAAEASGLGLPAQGELESLPGGPTCDWQGDRGGLLIGVNEDVDLDDVVFEDTAVVADVVVGDRRARRAPDVGRPGSCSVVLELGVGSVSLVALYLDDPPRACEVADRAAQLVEPKLP